MPSPRRAAFHWSGGKDSALALAAVLRDDRYVVDRLLTTVHCTTQESSVHGIPVHVLLAQAERIGLPLDIVELPGPTLEGYPEAMADTSRRLRGAGIDSFVFGDLAASGVRRYKEEQFGPFGIEVVTPLWDLSSRECIESFLDSGIRALTIVVEASALDRSFVGQLIDRAFVDRLPAGADPSGELGEYHSIVLDAPFFSAPLEVQLGEPQWIEHVWETTEGPRRYAYWILPVS